MSTSSTVKIQLSLHPDLVRALRLFLAENDRAKKGQLSDFFADLAKARLSDWVRSRAASSGHEADLTPEGLAALMRRGLLGAQVEKNDPSSGAAPPAATPFSEAEVLALVRAAQDWAAAATD